MTEATVLIVEDDALTACSVALALQSAGYKVCGVAGSEDEAISAAEETRPDFAIVDVNLSPGDGRVVARQLVERFHTAVLMATGHCNSPAMLRGIGASACLPKPYDADEVAPALEAVRMLAHGEPLGRLPGNMLRLD
jgi:DNA-binding response OmpR family regulator